MIKFSFSIEHVHHTMIEASADLSGTELGFPPDSDPDPQCTLPTWRCCTPASRRRWTVAVARSLEEIGHIRWVSDASIR